MIRESLSLHSAALGHPRGFGCLALSDSDAQIHQYWSRCGWPVALGPILESAPLSAVQPYAKIATAYSRKNRCEMPGERIMVIDSDAHVLESCVSMLESGGYQVTGVTSGRRAIDMARQQRFDLVLADLTVDSQDGLDTVQAIKAIDPGIVGVVMTG